MSWKDEALYRSLVKIEKNITAVGEHFPHVSYDGIYREEPASFWTSGFWPGLLWLLHEETGSKEALKLAGALEERLDPVLDGFVTLHHDVGFMWLPSAVADYKRTGREASRVRGLKAASHLAGRFNLAGRFIRAWTDEVNPDSKGWAIIDCMMNLPLLFWASKELGDPRFSHIARSHGDTVLKHFIRPDAAAAHIVSFDAVTGERLGELGGQGKGPGSAWSRGQAWAIYGMAAAYRETGNEAYLTASKNVAGYFLSHLPKDRVPYWDFRAGQEERWVLDSSASACAASGMLELARLVGDEAEQDFYQSQAEEILKSLYENYGDFSEGQQGILLKGTVNYARKKHVNVPIIYGDYFFVEALIKLKRNVQIF